MKMTNGIRNDSESSAMLKSWLNKLNRGSRRGVMCSKESWKSGGLMISMVIWKSSNMLRSYARRLTGKSRRVIMRYQKAQDWSSMIVRMSMRRGSSFGRIWRSKWRRLSGVRMRSRSVRGRRICRRSSSFKRSLRKNRRKRLRRGRCNRHRGLRLRSQFRSLQLILRGIRV